MVNRLAVGLVFAVIHQAMTGFATSVLSIPLTGTIQDLFWSIGNHDPDVRVLAAIWWAVSTVAFTVIAAQIVRLRRYISPYKKESPDVFPGVTIVSLIVLGAIMSFLFFLIDLAIGAIGTVSSVETVYHAAVSGDFSPLAVNLIFSVAAGFVVVGVIGRAAKIREMTHGVGAIDIGRIKRRFSGKKPDVKTIAGTAGMEPEALVHVGRKRVDRVWFSTIRYDKERFSETPKTYDIEECLSSTDGGVSWISMTGIHDAESVRRFGERFGMHPLHQADIMNTELRPSMAEDGDKLFVVLKIPNFDEDGNLITEHVCLVLGSDYVLSFQEAEGDVFEGVRANLRQHDSNIRARGSDYLVYVLTDAIVDYFFVIMEWIGEKVENLEHQLMTNPTAKTPERIHALKRQMMIMRRIIWPIREVISSLERSNSPLIRDTTRQYLRDVYGHTVQTMDTLESLRDMVGGMLDTYLSSISNKTNEVMKTLTIIASIFIPITFIAGIYGTNFDYIPELAWEGSYFVMLAIMCGISAVMLVWFRRKSWL